MFRCLVKRIGDPLLCFHNMINFSIVMLRFIAPDVLKQLEEFFSDIWEMIVHVT